MIRLTSEEERAIAALQKLANKWPQSLSLFSFAGSLAVLKIQETANDKAPIDFVVGWIDGIPNDGGDV